MVSLRFTFAVCFTQQSYYRQQKTYQVVSVATLHVNQPAAPVAIEGPEGADREAQKEDQQKETTETVAAVSGDKIDGLSPPAKHVHGTSLSNTRASFMHTLCYRPNLVSVYLADIPILIRTADSPTEP
jgi:hypothetical protein